jgi:hypothetical protein
LFTVTDATGSLWATLCFVPVLFTPGYVVAWVTNLLGFRRRSLVDRALWSVPTSLSLMAWGSVELAKNGSIESVARLAWWSAVSMLILAGWEWRGLFKTRTRWHRAQSFRRWLGLAGVPLGIAFFAFFVVGELVDIGFGNRLWMSVTVYDHALRSAFVDAVLRTGVPPHNPLYWTTWGGAGHAAPMRYYYFWYVLVAVAAKLGGVTARQGMVASCVWAGFILASIILLFTRYFLAYRGRRVGVIAIALLSVTGLDLWAVIGNFALGGRTDPDMEWWSVTQVASWLDSLLWAPHHIAALVCCLFGFLLVWMGAEGFAWQRLLCCGLAGVGFASAFGLSTYVAVAFALVMTAWLVRLLAANYPGRGRAALLAGAGLVAVILLLPYLQELALGGDASSPRGTRAGASRLFALGIRPMINPGPDAATLWHRSFLHLALLAPGYLTELGFYALVLGVFLVRASRQRTVDEGQKTAIFLTIAGLVVATFLQSKVIGTNDFGIRSMLIPQFFLLLLGATLLGGDGQPQRRSAKVALAVTLVVGLAGTVYQAILLRVYLPVEERLGRSDMAGLAERNMVLREGLDRMDEIVPRDAVVQYDTHQPGIFFLYAELIHVRRQTVTAMPECDTVFGGEVDACDGIRAAVARVFEEPSPEEESFSSPIEGARPAVSAAEAMAICEGLQADYLIATRWDPVWRERTGWVWTLPMVVATPDLRVLRCGTRPARE